MQFKRKQFNNIKLTLKQNCTIRICNKTLCSFNKINMWNKHLPRIPTERWPFCYSYELFYVHRPSAETVYHKLSYELTAHIKVFLSKFGTFSNIVMYYRYSLHESKQVKMVIWFQIHGKIQAEMNLAHFVVVVIVTMQHCIVVY